MNDFLPDPPRWKEHLDQANLAEREAGQMIRFMHTPELLPAAQLMRIAAGIRAARPRRRYFWLTVTAALLFCGATAASAAYLDVFPGWLTRIVRSQSVEPVTQQRVSRGTAKRAPAAAVVNPPSLPEANSAPAPLPAVSEQPAPNSANPMVGSSSIAGVPMLPAPQKLGWKPMAVTHTERQAAPTPLAQPTELQPPSASPSLDPTPVVDAPLSGTHGRGPRVALIERPAHADLAGPAAVVPDKDKGSLPVPETSNAQSAAKCLSEAIRALRVEHSPGSALLLLDRQATLLGKSAFAHEALLLRVEAMLALGLKREVLSLLDSAALTDVAASRSLLVTRGELRASANRCADGLADFDRVLSRSMQADKQALFGRALCRKKLGDGAGARADVERYRREFPSDPRLRDLEKQIDVSK
jgi:hypothetical protein